MSNLSSGKIKWLLLKCMEKAYFLNLENDKIDQWLQTSGSYFSEIINKVYDRQIKTTSK